MANNDDPSSRARAKMQAMKDALTEVSKPENMRKYGQAIADMIRLRTRLGQGVERDGDNKENLKGLKPATVKERQALQKKGLLSGLTTPVKSNLTRTGQLLDSVDIKSVDTGHVTVGPMGDRTDSKATNADIAKYQEDQGRPFNHLSNIELKRLNDSVKRDVMAIIRAKLTNQK